MGWGSWCTVVGLDEETPGPCHGRASSVTRGSPGQDSARASAPTSSPKCSRSSRASCASPPDGEGGRGPACYKQPPATTPATDLTLSVQKETFPCEHRQQALQD